MDGEMLEAGRTYIQLVDGKIRSSLHLRSRSQRFTFIIHSALTEKFASLHCMNLKAVFNNGQTNAKHELQSSVEKHKELQGKVEKVVGKATAQTAPKAITQS